MQAVIPVAGEGTRLRPATGGLPKSLVRVGGRPLLDWLLLTLSPPVREVCLVVGPDAAARFRERYGERWEGIRVRYAVQPRPLGVADAVARARPAVSGGFVTVMGDAYYDRPLGPELETWRDSRADGAVLVESVTDPPEDPIGLAWSRDGEVVRLEKTRWRDQADRRIAGAFCLPAAFFDVMSDLDAGPEGEAELEGAVTLLLERGHRFLALEYDGWRRNVNRPADLRRVERRIRGERE